MDEALVRQALLSAWDESQPESPAAHEEGGFVLRDADGLLSVERWPRGQQNRIAVPEHPACQRNGLTIVATFHTHPNSGQDFQQEPSRTDIRAVRDDPDLGGTDYEGEYVISAQLVYIVRKNGDIQIVGPTTSLLLP